MTLKEAMTARHMVRRYLDKQLSTEIVNQLSERIYAVNKAQNVAMKLVVNDTSAFSAPIRMLLAKGVQNYIVLSGEDTLDLGEKLGYASADIMLYAQTLGLNTWWVGGTFSRKGAGAHADGAKTIGVVAIGYGATQGVPHKSKTAEEVSTYSGIAPEWFINGVSAALLAPTALNKQKFSIKGHENHVKIMYAKGAFSGADLGLVKYHFELGAGKDNFEWD